MSATTIPRTPKQAFFQEYPLQLAASQNALQGTIACIDTSANVCTNAVSANANLIAVGDFAETLNNTASTTAPVLVRFDTGKWLEWVDNDTGTPVTALYSTCYLLDNHTVTGASSGNSPAGRVWDLDTVRGVLLEKTYK